MREDKAAISDGADSSKEGDSRVPKETVVVWIFPTSFDWKESIAVVKLRYCERVPTQFPVVFAGEAYVGEGTVLNLSVPGCAIHSRKPVEPGSYLEMRMLVPDITPPLRVGLAKVRWCEGRRFGVEFIQMPGQDQVRLGRLVKNEVPLAEGQRG
ncbi:MAG: PilZ domain-containing protein [Nitrospira sp. CG24A]|nr:MAG: PilZ domain-containing protein [Nitrospira sp. CG24A]